MTVEEFQKAFRNEINQLLARVQTRYSVSEEEMGSSLHASARKFLARTLEDTTGNPGPTEAARAQLSEFMSSLNCEDLCLAVACAKGDEAAWEDFFRDYRSYLISIARTMTSDPSNAEHLADSTFAELYGGCANRVVRESASSSSTRAVALFEGGSARWCFSCRLTSIARRVASSNPKRPKTWTGWPSRQT